MSDLEDCELKIGDKLAFIDFGVTPNYFIIVNEKLIFHEDNLVQILEKVDVSRPLPPFNLESKLIVAARWNEDGKMYRAVINEYDMGLKQAKIRFIE